MIVCRVVTVPVAFLAFVWTAHAEQPSVTLDDGRVVAVEDGDSILVDGVEWQLRGFDAPEIDAAQCEGERRVGLFAKRRLEAMLTSGGRVEIIDSGERDRHRRPLGDLVIAGRNVRETLIAEGYARPYNGGRKKGWCSRDSRDDLIPGPLPARDRRKGS